MRPHRLQPRRTHTYHHVQEPGSTLFTPLTKPTGSTVLQKVFGIHQDGDEESVLCAQDANTGRMIQHGRLPVSSVEGWVQRNLAFIQDRVSALRPVRAPHYINTTLILIPPTSLQLSLSRDSLSFPSIRLPLILNYSRENNCDRSSSQENVLRIPSTVRRQRE